MAAAAAAGAGGGATDTMSSAKPMEAPALDDPAAARLVTALYGVEQHAGPWDALTATRHVTALLECISGIPERERTGAARRVAQRLLRRVTNWAWHSQPYDSVDAVVARLRAGVPPDPVWGDDDDPNAPPVPVPVPAPHQQPVSAVRCPDGLDATVECDDLGRRLWRAFAGLWVNEGLTPGSDSRCVGHLCLRIIDGGGLKWFPADAYVRSSVERGERAFDAADCRRCGSASERAFVASLTWRACATANAGVINNLWLTLPDAVARRVVHNREQRRDTTATHAAPAPAPAVQSHDLRYAFSDFDARYGDTDGHGHGHGHDDGDGDRDGWRGATPLLRWLCVLRGHDEPDPFGVRHSTAQQVAGPFDWAPHCDLWVDAPTWRAHQQLQAVRAADQQQQQQQQQRATNSNAPHHNGNGGDSSLRRWQAMAFVGGVVRVLEGTSTRALNAHVTAAQAQLVPVRSAAEAAAGDPAADPDPVAAAAERVAWASARITVLSRLITLRLFPAVVMVLKRNAPPPALADAVAHDDVDRAVALCAAHGWPALDVDAADATGRLPCEQLDALMAGRGAWASSPATTATADDALALRIARDTLHAQRALLYGLTGRLVHRALSRCRSSDSDASAGANADANAAVGTGTCTATVAAAGDTVTVTAATAAAAAAAAPASLSVPPPLPSLPSLPLLGLTPLHALIADYVGGRLAAAAIARRC